MYIHIYIYTHYLSCPADDPGAPSWPSGNMSSQLLKDIRTHWLAPNLMQWLWAQLDGSSVSCYILLLGGPGATFKYTGLPHVDLNRAPKNNSAKSTMSPVRSGKVNATFKCTVMTWVDMNSVCKVPNLVSSLVPTFKAYQTTGDTSATKVRASPCGWNLWLVPPRDITGWLERSRLEEWATSRVAWVKEFLSEKKPG